MIEIMIWSIYDWNNSYLYCGCRWKWSMISAVNFPTCISTTNIVSLATSQLLEILNFILKIARSVVQKSCCLDPLPATSLKEHLDLLPPSICNIILQIDGRSRSKCSLSNVAGKGSRHYNFCTNSGLDVASWCTWRTLSSPHTFVRCCEVEVFLFGCREVEVFLFAVRLFFLPRVFFFLPWNVRQIETSLFQFFQFAASLCA